jgi:hypothetical protein
MTTRSLETHHSHRDSDHRRDQLRPTAGPSLPPGVASVLKSGKSSHQPNHHRTRPKRPSAGARLRTTRLNCGLPDTPPSKMPGEGMLTEPPVNTASTFPRSGPRRDSVHGASSAGHVAATCKLLPHNMIPANLPVTRHIRFRRIPDRATLRPARGYRRGRTTRWIRTSGPAVVALTALRFAP